MRQDLVYWCWKRLTPEQQERVHLFTCELSGKCPGCKRTMVGTITGGKGCPTLGRAECVKNTRPCEPKPGIQKCHGCGESIIDKTCGNRDCAVYQAVLAEWQEESRTQK